MAIPARRAAHRRIPRSFYTRAVYSTAMIAAVLLVGTLGLHLLEGYSYIDAFYFTSMVATGQGPYGNPATAAGKIFVSILAFVSTGVVITALVFLFGPFFGAVFRSGFERLEEDAERELGRGEKSEGTGV